DVRDQFNIPETISGIAVLEVGEGPSARGAYRGGGRHRWCSAAASQLGFRPSARAVSVPRGGGVSDVGGRSSGCAAKVEFADFNPSPRGPDDQRQDGADRGAAKGRRREFPAQPG